MRPSFRPSVGRYLIFCLEETHRCPSVGFDQKKTISPFQVYEFRNEEREKLAEAPGNRFKNAMVSYLRHRTVWVELSVLVDGRFLRKRPCTMVNAYNVSWIYILSFYDRNSVHRASVVSTRAASKSCHSEGTLPFQIQTGLVIHSPFIFMT